MTLSELKAISLILDTHPAAGLRGYNLPLARITRSAGTHFCMTAAAAASLERASSVHGAYLRYCRTVGSDTSVRLLGPAIFFLLARSYALPGVAPGDCPLLRIIDTLAQRDQPTDAQPKPPCLPGSSALEVNAKAILDSAQSVDDAIRQALAGTYRTGDFIFVVACAAISRGLALGVDFSRLVGAAASYHQ